MQKFVTQEGILARALPVARSVENAAVVNLEDPADAISRSFNKGSGKSQFLNAGVFFANKAYTYKTLPNYKGSKKVLADVLQDDSLVPKEYFVDQTRIAEWEYLKGAKTIERVHKASGTAYNYAEGKMAFPDLITNPSRTILTGEGGTSPSRFKHIIKTKKGYRRLTPVELERLNGFPDGWTAFGVDANEISDVRRAFFMGNALVVGLIERVGQVLAEEIKSIPRARK
jgi:DNA (cytosine-5)-methyltransferase 1